MAIKYPVWQSKIAMQSIQQVVAESPVGALPTVNQEFVSPPSVNSQGDSFFSRDSIGSAIFETRNFETNIVGPARQLTRCKNSAAISQSLSPQRPVLLSTLNFPFPEAYSLQQFQTVTNLEHSLSKADYEFLTESLRNDSATSAVFADVERKSNADIQLAGSQAASICKLAIDAENFSAGLDVKYSWDQLKDSIASNYANLSSDYSTGPVITEQAMLVSGSDEYTSTLFLNSLVSRVTAENSLVTTAIRGLESRLSLTDFLFDDGSISDYSNQPAMKKAMICCYLLARIMQSTYSGITGDASIPTIYNSGSISGPVFESQANYFGRSNYDILTFPAVSSLNTSVLENFKSSFGESFRSSIGEIERRAGIITGEEKLTAVSIFQNVLKTVYESFPSLTGGDANPDEITDALILVLSLKSQTSNLQFNGLIRGSILSMLLNSNVSSLRYTLAIEPEILSDLPRDTSVIAPGFLSAYENNFPEVARNYARSVNGKELLRQLDPGGSSATGNSTGNFTSNIPRTTARDTGLEFGYLPIGYDVESVRKQTSLPAICKVVTKAIDAFARKGSVTIATAITRVYSSLNSDFQQAYGINSQASAFRLRDGSQITKKAIYDILIECIGNICKSIIAPGYSDPTTAESETVTISLYTLSPRNDFRASLEFCNKLSSLKGNLDRGFSSITANIGFTDAQILSADEKRAFFDLLLHTSIQRSRIATLYAISDAITKYSDNLANSINAASQVVTGFSNSAKRDIFADLSVETASQSAQYANFLKRCGTGLVENDPLIDLTVAFTYIGLLSSSGKKLTISSVGMPANFLQTLRREPSIGAPSKNPRYYEIVPSVRSITSPYEVPQYGGTLYLHPLVSARFVLGGRGGTPVLQYSCFSRITGDWLDVSEDGCAEFIKRGGNFEGSERGYTSDEVSQILKFHHYDAVTKCILRSYASLDLESWSIGTQPPKMRKTRAQELLSLMSLARRDLIPRRGLTASQFLKNVNEEFLVVPFSSLSENASGLTTPADHSLLINFLNSGLFMSSTAKDRILRTSPLERVYSFIQSMDDFENRGGELITEDTEASKCSIISYKIVAKY